MTRHGRASRERIVERAAKQFAERGTAATSVDEVLAAAGAGKGQFYRYFRGRDELTPAAVGFRCAEVVAGLTEALGTVSSLAAAGFDAWKRLLADALERIRQRGELRADAPPAMLATGLLASIEGGMVLSQARKSMALLRVALRRGWRTSRRTRANSVLIGPLTVSGMDKLRGACRLLPYA